VKTRGDADTKLTNNLAQEILDRKAAIAQEQKDRKDSQDLCSSYYLKLLQYNRANGFEFAHSSYLDKRSPQKLQEH
jgi:hypothetical protein